MMLHYVIYHCSLAIHETIRLSAFPVHSPPKMESSVTHPKRLSGLELGATENKTSTPDYVTLPYIYRVEILDCKL